MLGQMNFFEAIQTAFSIQNFGAVPCGTHMCPLVNTFPPPSLVWIPWTVEQWGGERGRGLRQEDVGHKGYNLEVS